MTYLLLHCQDLELPFRLINKGVAKWTYLAFGPRSDVFVMTYLLLHCQDLELPFRLINKGVAKKMFIYTSDHLLEVNDDVQPERTFT
jgi:hypothetical protein